jgi:hypothetical protein
MTANVLLIRSVAQYTAVNLIAGAGILGNVGGVALAANTALGNAISTYTSNSTVSRFANIVSSAASNAGGAITYSVVSSTAPWLTNSLPAAYSNIYGVTMTNAITSQAANIMGHGDLGKFNQVFGAAQGLVASSNEIINSVAAANSHSTAVGFTNTDNAITGGVSALTQAFQAFALDLGRLGRAINLANLNNLGSPQALLQQLLAIAGFPTGLNTALLNAGLTVNEITTISTTGMTDAQQKKAYTAMTQVTGQDLLEVLSLLRVQTSGIVTMADLLNPAKTFPNSFNTFSAPTADGYRGIYLNSTGTVNTNLETTLPQSVLYPLQGNPLQNMELRPQR